MAASEADKTTTAVKAVETSADRKISCSIVESPVCFLESLTDSEPEFYQSIHWVFFYSTKAT